MSGCCVKIKKRRKIKTVIFAVAIFILLAAYLFIKFSVRPVISTVSQEKIRSLTVETVNASVAKVMSENPAYVNLTVVDKDDSGNITMISTNSGIVNELARNVTVQSQITLDKLSQEGISIPFGSLSGISFLSGRGPDVVIKAIPVGNIVTDFSSEFTAAGINQTLHKLYVTVTAAVNIIIPGAENKITTTVKVLVTETVIIGKVPQIYLSGKSPQYNLVP